MSGPPHHSHNRQPPPGAPAWNHLQVPNFFPRQPQHAHMSNEHHLAALHQPTWHTPTTEPAMKSIALPHVFGLDHQMLPERQYRAGGVDLTLTRNGQGANPSNANPSNANPNASAQNGEAPPPPPAAPISLSVRDTNKINSLPPGALGIQAVELTKNLNMSPGGGGGGGVIKPMSPALSTSPGLQDSPKSSKKKRMDTVLEKLNPGSVEKPTNPDETQEKSIEKPLSVVIQEENSNSSSVRNAPTPTNEELISPYSNDDSLDSNKSRRKRKPSKTIRVTAKEQPETIETTTTILTTPSSTLTSREDVVDGIITTNEDKRDEDSEEVPAKKARRKTSSESETIEKIASMVQEVVQEGAPPPREGVGDAPPPKESEEADGENREVAAAEEKAVEDEEDEEEEEEEEEDGGKEKEKAEEAVVILTPVAVTTGGGVVTAAQRKATNFVEVENKLEEMFAGIEEETPKSDEPPKPDETIPEITSSTTETREPEAEAEAESSDGKATTTIANKQKGKQQQQQLPTKRKTTTPKKKKGNKPSKSPKVSKKDKRSINGKIESMKDVYAYDSGSNASSAKSRGPFVHIEGNRDSPVSVSIINTPTEDDNEKRNNKLKKFHDDSEYRHKVRSKGLHCSTLSNKYDAQTKDASWICVFCKRGPHSTDVALSAQFYPPGDLFGPYVVTSNCPEFERKCDDPYDKQFKSKKIARSLETTPLQQQQQQPKNSKKTKRKSQSSADHPSSDNPHHHLLHPSAQSSDVYLGITRTSDETFEVWTHEDCVAWAPGVYLVGPKIVGLEEAVWAACDVRCVRCGSRGANLCCLRRGCPNVVHFGCGAVSDWSLDYDTFRAYCVEHKALSGGAR